MRAVFAFCSVDYSGRLDTHLPLAKRLLIVKGDGSVLVHSDGGGYKPINWMAAPCKMHVSAPDKQQIAAGIQEIWTVKADKTDDCMVITIHELITENICDLGLDPGLQKDGVEAHLQKLLAEQVELIAANAVLVQREYPTAIGPVDIMLRAKDGHYIAVEVKRRGEIDGVEQITRYLDLIRRDVHIPGLRGVFAAQSIKPQARTLAEDRGIECVILDYLAMKDADNTEGRLF